jgi:PAS domain-containing protein
MEVLQESEEKLRFLFESIVDGISVLDLEGKVLDTNEASVRIGGHSSREQLIGRNGIEFVKKEDRERAVKDLGFAGVNVEPGFADVPMYADDPKIYPVYAKCEELLKMTITKVCFYNHK